VGEFDLELLGLVVGLHGLRLELVHQRFKLRALEDELVLLDGDGDDPLEELAGLEDAAVAGREGLLDGGPDPLLFGRRVLLLLELLQRGLPGIDPEAHRLDLVPHLSQFLLLSKNQRTTRHDTTRHDTTRHDTTRQDTTRHDTTRHDTTRHDTTRHDTTRHDTTRHDTQCE
jgi:hypothetical protein